MKPTTERPHDNRTIAHDPQPQSGASPGNPDLHPGVVRPRRRLARVEGCRHKESKRQRHLKGALPPQSTPEPPLPSSQTLPRHTCGKNSPQQEQIYALHPGPPKQATPQAATSTMYTQLYKEHLQLQRAHALLKQSLAHSAAKSKGWQAEKESLENQIQALTSQVDALKQELSESRDQAELLEFCILELETKPEARSVALTQRMDKGTDPDPLVPAGAGIGPLEMDQSEIVSGLQNLYNHSDLKEKEKKLIGHLLAYYLGNKLQLLFNTAKRKSDCEKCYKKLALLELSEQKLVEKNIKLYIDYVSAKEQIQKLISENESESGSTSSKPSGIEDAFSFLAASEDEGLGEESSRPACSTGPSSLADLQETEDLLNRTTDGEIYDTSQIENPHKIEDENWENNNLYIKGQELTKRYAEAEEIIAELKEKLQIKDYHILKLEEDNKEFELKVHDLETQIKEKEKNNELKETQYRESIKQSEEQRRKLDEYITQLENELKENKRKIEVQTKSTCDLKKIKELQFELTYKDEIVKRYEEHFRNIKLSPSKIPIKSTLSTQRHSSPLKNIASKISFSHGNLNKLGLYELKSKVDNPENNQKDSIPKSNDSKSQRMKSNFSLHPQRWFRKKVRSSEVLGNSLPVDRIPELQGELHASTKTPSNSLSSPDPLRISTNETTEINIKEKLFLLEKNNREFEKDLESREKLCKQKERHQQQYLSTERELKESIQNLEAEKTSIIKRISELMLDKTHLQEQLEKLQLELKNSTQRYQQNCETISLKHNILCKSQKMKIASLENKQTGALQKIASLESEKADILSSAKSQDDKISFVTMALDILKQEHYQLQTEINCQKEAIDQSEIDYKSKINMLEKNYSNEIKTFQNEIESLKKKKSELEIEITMLNEKDSNLACQLQAKEQELLMVKNEYEISLQVLEEQHRLIEVELQCKLKQIEETAEATVKSMEEERKILEKCVKEDMKDLKTKEAAYKTKISELENRVRELHKEIEHLAGDSWKQSNEKNLRRKLSEYENREKILKQRLEENERKEEAYKETLLHAEKLVASIEQNYRNKIDEMEKSEQALRQRIALMEASEHQLHARLYEERRLSDGRKSSELIHELMEADGRETALREKIEEIEAQNRSLLQKVRDLEKSLKNLNEEVNHKDDLIQKVEKLKVENAELKKEISTISQSKKVLQEALRQTDSFLTQRNEDMNLKILSLEKERQELKDTIINLRCQIQDLKHLLEKHEEERLSNEVAHHLLNLPQQKIPEDCSMHPENPVSQASMIPCHSSFENSSPSKHPPHDVQACKRPLERLKEKPSKAQPAHPVANAPLPPHKFRILRQVGEDGLLVGWHSPGTGTTAACYQLYVNGELHQNVRSPDRTKALLHRLDLSRDLEVSILTISVSGLRSVPASLSYPRDLPPTPPPPPPRPAKLANAAALKRHPENLAKNEDHENRENNIDTI